MKNWKSTIGFLTFVGAYVYTVHKSYAPTIIETTGYLLLFATLFVMMRSENLTEIVKDLAAGFKHRFKDKE